MTPQYSGLEELYKKYQEQGLVVAGFPCNQFRNQEPGSDEEIQSFCQINYGVSFPMHRKVDVKGEKADPFFRYLSEQAPGVLGSKSIKWNFTKFLVNRAGTQIKRFAPMTTPEKLEGEILALLAAPPAS